MRAEPPTSRRYPAASAWPSLCACLLCTRMPAHRLLNPSTNFLFTPALPHSHVVRCAQATRQKLLYVASLHTRRFKFDLGSVLARQKADLSHPFPFNAPSLITGNQAPERSAGEKRRSSRSSGSRSRSSMKGVVAVFLLLWPVLGQANPLRVDQWDKKLTGKGWWTVAWVRVF